VDGKPVNSVGDVEGRKTVVGNSLGRAVGVCGCALGLALGKVEGVSEGALLVHMQQSAGHVT